MNEALRVPLGVLRAPNKACFTEEMISKLRAEEQAGVSWLKGEGAGFQDWELAQKL